MGLCFGVMHPWRPWLACVCLALASGAQATTVIYKWVDAQGVVHYSDQPTPGAERIVVDGAATHGITPGSEAGAPPAAAAEKPAAGLPYTTLSIASPAAEQTFFGDDSVPVSLRLEPSLQPGHVVAWFLNGQKVEDQGPQSTGFSLSGLPRGTYTIGVTVTDPNTGRSQSSDPVTFYVQQPSLLSPQHKH